MFPRSDTDALKAAKTQVYQKGFFNGVMLVGPYAGKTVEFAKPKLRSELIAGGQAVPYSEPAGVPLCCAVASHLYTHTLRHEYHHTAGFVVQWQQCNITLGLKMTESYIYRASPTTSAIVMTPPLPCF